MICLFIFYFFIFSNFLSYDVICYYYNLLIYLNEVFLFYFILIVFYNYKIYYLIN